MIHLKRFNEGQFYTIENILYEFAKDNLAYVLDIEGMKMTLTIDKRLSDSGRFNYYEFNLTNSYFFEWRDIKDYFIPFLQRLQRLDYVSVCPLGTGESQGKEIKVRTIKKDEEFGFTKSEYYSLEDVLNDIFYLRDISKITFYIKQIN
jgi:hypothetical protein